jgi:hypothetical protein
MMKLRATAVAITLAIAAGTQAFALQSPLDWNPVIGSIGTGIPSASRAAAKKVDVQKLSRESAKPAPTGQAAADLIVRRRVASVDTPAQLAAIYPEKTRPQMVAYFKQLQKGWSEMEGKFGLQPGDMGGAMAAFIAGSYMGYRNVTLPDAQFARLIEQTRAYLGGNPAVRGLGDADKQAFYETLSTMGMYVAMSQLVLAKQPDPDAIARMQEAGKQYLEDFLGVAADRVVIDERGLSLR